MRKEYYETYVDISDSGLGRLQKEWLDQVRVASLHDFTKVIEERKNGGVKEVLRLNLELKQIILLVVRTTITIFTRIRRF